MYADQRNEIVNGKFTRMSDRNSFNYFKQNLWKHNKK